MYPSFLRNTNRYCSKCDTRITVLTRPTAFKELLNFSDFSNTA